MDAILHMYMNELTRRQDRSGEMNERIDQLMWKAGAEFEFLNHVHYDNFSYEQFARLIIDECVKVCYSRAGNSDYNTGRMHCASDLKEHFGIKNE